MFFPKSLSLSGFALSSVRYFFSIDHVNMYTPIDARLLLGSFGFSSNSKMRPSSSAFMMPNDDAFFHGTGRTAMVMSAFLRMCASSIRL